MSLIEYLQQNPVIFYVYITVVGLLIGSFLNVVIYRLPKMLHIGWRQQCVEFMSQDQVPKDATDPAGQHEKTDVNDSTEAQSPSEKPYNLMVPRSHCPQCHHRIGALENIPIVSFAYQRGKCAHCDAPIPWRYPIIEALTGLLSLLVALHFGLSWQTGAALILTWSLIALSVIDFDHQLLPDDITMPVLWLGLLLALGGLFADLQSSVIGAVAGYLCLWSVYWAFKLLTKKEGMGYGDFKLLALFGAWLGWQMLPVIVLLSSLVGAIVGISLILFRGRNRNIPIPFGPYLAAAGWLALFWGHDMTNYYLVWAGMHG